MFITDGKIYTGHLEHSPIDPRPRGGPFVCLNATTGELIWRADGMFRQTRWGGRAIIGDSIIATMDTYDQRVYAIGKGPSKTTVEIETDVIPWGNSLMIQGMVTDVSPGTMDYGLMARFPNGVPAIADEYMSEWMLQLYKQFPCPDEIEGVDVRLWTFDPNGNTYDIANVTCDAHGFYSVMWEPPVPGEYIVYATFEGSNSYYASEGVTAMGVVEAPSPAVPMEPEPVAPEPVAPAPAEPEPAAPEPTELGSIESIPTETESIVTLALGATEIALIAAVAVAVVMSIVAFWALRKRK